MKKSVVVCSLVLALSIAAVVFAAPQGPGGGGGRGGGRGAPAPPATGPIADLVNKFVEAVNKQDAAYLNSVLAEGALWLDEDGHIVPASAWVGKLTATAGKKLAVATQPMPLRVGDFTADTAFAAFNYTLDETVTPRGQTAAVQNQMKGLASMVFKKVGNDWKVVMVHAPVNGAAITPH